MRITIKKTILLALCFFSMSLWANNKLARQGFISDNKTPEIEETMNAQGIEGFEDVGNLPNWILDNQSDPNGSSSWFQGNKSVFLAQSGSEASYVAANFNNAGGENICNWLILPDLGYLQTLSFWSRTTSGAIFPDRLLLLHSPTGGINTGDCINGFGDFTRSMIEINSELSPNTYPEAWTEFNTNINADGRVAFVYFVEDISINGNYIGIDNLQWLSGLPEADLSITTLSDVNSELNIGDSVILTHTVTNNGPQNASSTEVTINFDEGLTHISNSCSAEINGTSLVWQIGDLTNGMSVECQVELEITESSQQFYLASVDASEVDVNQINNSNEILINARVAVIPTLNFYGLLLLILVMFFNAKKQISNQFIIDY